MTHAVVIAALCAVPIAVSILLWFTLAAAGQFDDDVERRTGERRS